MHIWVDDVRPAPYGYVRAHSVDETKLLISKAIAAGKTIELLDLDHDAGDYAEQGGDFIRILDWLEVSGISIPIRLHTLNPVGRDNMEAIITKNGWKLVR